MVPPSPFLEEHLNVWWLRPEAALWDALASTVVSQVGFIPPSLDLGAGNGIFSFITAGGAFSPNYDWFRNVDADGFWENRDIYDTVKIIPRKNDIVSQPSYQIDYAFDRKINLLHQVKALQFYKDAVVGDANQALPFADRSFETVFSNIFYWLESPAEAFKEMHRILRYGGRAYLCLQDPTFKELCVSYQWRERQSELLRLLNRGRRECSKWTITLQELEILSRKQGFRVSTHTRYLSPLTLKIWDIGLRPLSTVLVKWVGRLQETDRLQLKTEWIETVLPFLREVYLIEQNSPHQGGYHFVGLEKI